MELLESKLLKLRSKFSLKIKRRWKNLRTNC